MTECFVISGFQNSLIYPFNIAFMNSFFFMLRLLWYNTKLGHVNCLDMISHTIAIGLY